MIKRSTLFSVAALLISGSLMAQVTVKTKLPATAVPGGSFTVEINIAKSDVTGFAKLQQQLPPGFTAEAGEMANATFSFKDQKVKFLWMALPNEDFKVSYKVSVDGSLSGNQIIDGTFAYIKDNETEKLIIPKDIITIQADQVDAAKQAAMDKILADQKAKTEAANAAREEATPIVEEAAKEEVVAEVVKETKPAEKPAAKVEEVAEEVKEVAVDNSAELAAAAKKEEDARKAKEAKEAKQVQDAENARKKQEADDAKKAAKANQPAPAANDYNDSMMKSKAGLVFRVQIAAGPNQDDPSFYQKKYGISDAVVIEQHDGLNKYVVGEFGSYRPAKTFSNELRDNNAVAGPFVTAYNNGTRIHVKEALDIAGQ
jgi:chemotaxis protein histidine kinase CheA